MIRSNHFKWLTAILEKALNPLMADAQVLQIWSIQSSSCIFSQTIAYFKIKIHWDVCPFITSNLKGDVKILASNFLRTFWNCYFLVEIYEAWKVTSSLKYIFDIKPQSQGQKMFVLPVFLVF